MPFAVAPGAASLSGFAFHWHSQPCHGEIVSGDGLFIENPRRDEQHQLLLIDVMHHGATAAGIVDHIRDVLLPDPACWDLRPAGLLTLLNTWLIPVWEEQQIYVTAQAFLVQGDGTLVGSNAAIPDPRHRTLAPASVTWALPGGTMLGPVSPQTWTEGSLALAGGEGLLGFTDGVSEAGNPQFGQTHLDAFLAADPLGPGLIDRLFAALRVPRWPGLACRRHDGVLARTDAAGRPSFAQRAKIPGVLPFS